MSDMKQVKVDNWGIYFLQRLKHFFNRTDYCDLTLQFEDNAQLKVHRLVLSACTEYFELLERTCEMYEDCLVMPDDLQADVVVPIVNFMYTGQLEFKVELLERLYQTSQIMDMPVLTKLLDAQRPQLPKSPFIQYGAKHTRKVKPNKPAPLTSQKRTFSDTFQESPQAVTEKKNCTIAKKHTLASVTAVMARDPVTHKPFALKKQAVTNPLPTRYELPEELENDECEVGDNSFCSISYTSKPLVVHPNASKQYSGKKNSFVNNSSSKYSYKPVDIECKKLSKDSNIFYDDNDAGTDDSNMFETNVMNVRNPHQDSSQLFDNILDNNDVNDLPKITVENKDKSKNMNHAKIISEVLKKYPHLMKGNKNIKLKILNTSNTPVSKIKKEGVTIKEESKEMVPISTSHDYTYESDVLDSKEAARLISLGVDNVSGPWICLICGTPGKALNFTSYYKFRCHLVEVHNEKPVSTMCEFCGLKSYKRPYILHHLYTKHGVPPPRHVTFPKCNLCNYVALTEAFLVKHKMTHKSFSCNVCTAVFNSSRQLLYHIQATGHKYSADRKANLQCVYCMKVFLRESNLVAHLKTNHMQAALNDGIIEESDEEIPNPESNPKYKPVKYIKSEPVSNAEMEYEVVSQPRILERPVLSSPKKHVVNVPLKQKILNSGIDTQAVSIKSMAKPQNTNTSQEYVPENISFDTNDINDEEIVVIGETEYVMRDNHLIPKKNKTEEYILPEQDYQTYAPSTSMQYTNINEVNYEVSQPPEVIKKSTNQPIQIVVSNEEGYKALMSSNHSIVLNDVDTTKTLTVLSNPHDSTLTTSSIDINAAQNNDMVIIPNDYALNVTEGVSGTNPNIVVVYSHPVDQNKPYQLITAQGLESQFVHTSEVVTQTYETITDSTSVANSEDMIQGHAAWPTGNQETLEIGSQVIAEVQQTEIVVSNENEPEKPTDTQLESGKAISPVPSETEQNYIDNSALNNNVGLVINEENAEDITEVEMADVQNISDKEQPTEDIVIENIDHTEKTSVIVTTQADDENICLENDSKPRSCLPNKTNVIQVKGTQTSNQTQNVDVNEEDLAQEHREITVIVPNSNETNIIKPNENKIQSLTSEWSDDDEETIQQMETNELKESEQTMQPSQLEETIENIQHEVEREIDPNPPVQIGTKSTDQTMKTQEKLTSLLNDWEENDSQEENTEDNNIKITNDVGEINLVQNAEQSVNNSDIEKKNNSIKNLVSDWDEDEEEIKE